MGATKTPPMTTSSSLSESRRLRFCTLVAAPLVETDEEPPSAAPAEAAANEVRAAVVAASSSSLSRTRRLRLAAPPFPAPKLPAGRAPPDGGREEGAAATGGALEDCGEEEATPPAASAEAAASLCADTPTAKTSRESAQLRLALSRMPTWAWQESPRRRPRRLTCIPPTERTASHPEARAKALGPRAAARRQKVEVPLNTQRGTAL